ncbi:MAG: hypothetical protein E6G97_07460 [Alphaproteobacteria bacterium]|nr:MAG: hypothetical protein E6G97_07460 [Alphaproteobacteria bacterium]
MLGWNPLLCPIAGGFAPFVRTLSGGQSLTGFEQLQPQMHDRWSAAFTFHLKNKPLIFAVRAMLTQLRGRAGTILVPTFEDGRAPLSPPSGQSKFNPPFYQRFAKFAGTPYEFEQLADITGTSTITADDAFSFTATGTVPQAKQFVTIFGIKREIVAVSGGGPYICKFRPKLTGGAPTAGTVTATAAGAASLNATLLDVAFQKGGPPEPGNFFSIGARLYSINTADLIAPNTYRLDIWPWLRADVAQGAEINFVSPACEMRLASDAEGTDTLRALALLKFGDVTLRFDEVA